MKQATSTETFQNTKNDNDFTWVGRFVLIAD